MKDPHDSNEYESATAATDGTTESDAPPQPQKAPKKKKHRFSGAYYYVDADEDKLAKSAFIRTVLTTVAAILQIAILCLPQGSLEHITNDLPSYAYLYVMTVLVYIVITIWLAVMNMTRYKFAKRIPKERAPKNGFARRAYFGNELFIAANAALTALEISFVCISYDYVTLIAVFLAALATAAAVGARQVTHLALKNSVFVPAAKDPEDE